MSFKSFIIKLIRKLIGVERSIEENKKEIAALIEEADKIVKQMNLMRDDPEAFEKLSQTPEFIEEFKKNQKMINERKAKDAKELADRRAAYDKEMIDRRAEHDKKIIEYHEYIKNNS